MNKIEQNHFDWCNDFLSTTSFHLRSEEKDHFTKIQLVKEEASGFEKIYSEFISSDLKFFRSALISTRQLNMKTNQEELQLSVSLREQLELKIDQLGEIREHNEELFRALNISKAEVKSLKQLLQKQKELLEEQNDQMFRFLDQHNNLVEKYAERVEETIELKAKVSEMYAEKEQQK